MTDWEKVLNAVTPRDEMRNIVRAVADKYGVTAGDIMGSSKLSDYVWPRHVAMWRARKEMNLSYTQIGKFFNRDHSTVCHAIKKVEHAIGETKCLEA